MVQYYKKDSTVDTTMSKQTLGANAIYAGEESMRIENYGTSTERLSDENASRHPKSLTCLCCNKHAIMSSNEDADCREWNLYLLFSSTLSA